MLQAIVEQMAQILVEESGLKVKHLAWHFRVKASLYKARLSRLKPCVAQSLIENLRTLLQPLYIVIVN